MAPIGVFFPTINNYDLHAKTFVALTQCNVINMTLFAYVPCAPVSGGGRLVAGFPNLSLDLSHVCLNLALQLDLITFTDKFSGSPSNSENREIVCHACLTCVSPHLNN